MLDYDEATIDMSKNSVLDRKEKQELLEVVFVAAHSRIILESVKVVLLKSILDKDPAGSSDKTDVRNTG